jgi:AcrR family transcriptional regulator
VKKPANRHQQRKAATHQRLIDSARALIIARGYNQVDILDITEHANLSKATFYQHFSNKEACVRELMEQGFDALVAQILQARREIPVTTDWIRSSLQNVFEWAAANREFMLIMVGGAASSHLNVFGRNYMVKVTEESILSEFPPDVYPRRYPLVVQAQVVTGIVIQMLGWWLETDTGYSAQQMGHMLHQIIQAALGPLPE